MSTQHCGLTAPVASTTVYLLGAVHSTGVKRRIKKKQKNSDCFITSASVRLPTAHAESQVVWLHRLTFELESELIGVVEGEHLLVGRLIVGIENELSGEHEHRKASFHQFRLSMLLLLLHWLQLSSSPSPSHSMPTSPPPLSTQTIQLCELPLGGNGTSRNHCLRTMTWHCEEIQLFINSFAQDALVHLLLPFSDTYDSFQIHFIRIHFECDIYLCSKAIISYFII